MKLFKKEKNQIIICVDMDDTIENLIETWINEINIKYKKHYSICDVSDWDLRKDFPDLTEEQIFKVLHDKKIYDKVSAYLDAIEYLNRLNNDIRFKIYIATNTNYKVFSYKIDTIISKYFNFLKAEQIICISNKQLLNCDLLIDDYDGNLINGNYDKILINKPYNINCKTINLNFVNKKKDYNKDKIKRTNNWKDIYNYIIQKTNKNLW